jgi:alkylation response protein AidB-like acyl-CoA dehydrogenase
MVDADFVHPLREFVRAEVVPQAATLDAQDLFPTELAAELAKRGYAAVTLPPEYGGPGRDFRYAIAVFEEVGFGSATLAISLIAPMQAIAILRLYGSTELKDAYLPRFRSGLPCAFALTETGHGSDVRHLQTSAVRDGSHWRINGAKAFITSGSDALLYVVFAETDQGVSAFLVPRETAGLSIQVTDETETFGLRNGPHVNLILEDVTIPADHLIGNEGEGVKQAANTLNYSRTIGGGVCCGMACAAFEGALAHASGRAAFEQRVIDFQGIQWYFAEMLSDIDAARLVTYHAAETLASGDRQKILRYTSQAKLRATAVASRVAAQAVQICGARGTLSAAPFGRYMRDAKAYEVGGGSSEILKNTIAKFILEYEAADGFARSEST